MVGKIIQMISGNYGIIISTLLLLSIFIEVTPIKINPWSKIIAWVGSRLNKEMKESLDNVSSKVNTLSYEIDRLKIDNMRKAILDFGNSCMNNKKHTQEEFSNIIATHDKYLIILKKHGMKNGQVDLAYKYIENVYRECLENNDFLH